MMDGRPARRSAARAQSSRGGMISTGCARSTTEPNGNGSQNSHATRSAVSASSAVRRSGMDGIVKSRGTIFRAENPSHIRSEEGGGSVRVHQRAIIAAMLILASTTAVAQGLHDRHRTFDASEQLAADLRKARL